MRVRDINPADIEFIHVDRTEDGKVFSRVFEGDRERWLWFHADHKVTLSHRMVRGERFRLLLKESAVAVQPLAIGA